MAKDTINKTTILKKTKTDILVAVAVELSKEMNLDPAIDISLNKAGLLDAIIVDSQLVEISDKFSDETWSFLCKIHNPAALQRRENPELAEEKTKAKEKSQTAGKVKTKKITRTVATGKALIQRPKTKEELIALANKIYNEAGGPDNLKEAAWSVGTILNAFLIYGAIEMNDDGTLHYPTIK